MMGMIFTFCLELVVHYKRCFASDQHNLSIRCNLIDVTSLLDEDGR